MKTTLAALLLLGLAGLTGVAEASPTSDLLAVRRARNKPVKMGVWHADLEKAKAYAKQNGMPLIAVWSNGEDCSHCLVFERMAMAPVFTEWMKTSGYVFYFGVRDDGPSGPTYDGQEGYHGTSFYWCRMKNGGYDPNAGQNWPYVRIYWQKASGKVKVDEFRTGAATDGEYAAVPMPASKNCADNPKKFVVKGDDGTYNPSARYFINMMTNSTEGILRGYTYNPVPPYRGGEFGVPDAKTSPLAGLQLERGTDLETVTVPLTRTNATAQAFAGTNTLVATYPSGYTKSYQVNWLPAAKVLEFDIATKTNKWSGSSQYIDLVLYDGGTNASGAVTGKAVATNSIALVEKMENSPKNPLWIGERNPSELAWGEWTMDLDAATNKVNASVAGGASAYTLVLIGGPLWCPDCVRLEKVLFETETFKNWAKSKRIACVAVDLPKFTEGTSPTLLNREVKDITSQTMKNWGVGGPVSGTGYLSRKGISPAAAAVIQARNDKFSTADTDHGGFRLPEPSSSSSGKTGKWRAGVPCLVMLRSDGTVCGRIYEYSNSTDGLEDVGAEHVLARLKEMRSQAAEKAPDGKWTEESNDSVYTTKNVIELRNKAGLRSSLSFVDQADYYRINAPAGTEITFDLVNDVEDASTNATLYLSVVNGDLDDPDGNPVADTEGLTLHKGKLGEGIGGSIYKLPSGNCFVKIHYELDKYKYPVDAFFNQSNDSTVCKYRLRSDGIINPVETPALWVSRDGGNTAVIRLESGQEYVFTGILLEEDDPYLELLPNGHYRAKDMEPTFGLATIVACDKTKEEEWTFTYQKWTPGVVGFERTTATISEPLVEGETNFCRIAIRRAGGVSGVAKVRLELVPEETTSISEGLYVFGDTNVVFEVNNETLVTNTTIGVLANPFANNNERVTIRLVALEGSDASVATSLATFTLTIKDDDVANPGKLQIGAVNGALVPDSGLVVAKAGSDLTVKIDRVNGVDGSLIGLVTATGVSVDETEDRLIWDAMEADSRTVTLRLPAMDEVQGNRVLVALNGLSDSKVEPTAKYVTVQLVPVNSIAFSQTSVSYPLYKDVMGFSADIAVDVLTVQDLGNSKVSVSKISGSLPPGLSWAFVSSYDLAGSLRFSGTPTKAGTYRAIFRVSEDDVAGQTLQVVFNVTDCTKLPSDSADCNPYVGTARTFDSILVLDSESGSLAGVMTLTLPPSGRASAKIRELDGTTCSMLAQGWTGCDSGDYSCTLETARAGNVQYSASVIANKDGSVDVSLSRTEGAMPVLMTAVVAQPVADASVWKGYYTVSMPYLSNVVGRAAAPFATGAGYMTLKMDGDIATSAGSMLYAGMLPNGRFVSGSSTLVTAAGFGSKDAALPIVSASSDDLFGAVLVLNPTDECLKVMPYGESNPRWIHFGPGETEFDVELDAFGCRYVSTNDFVGCCCDQLGCSELTFFAETDKLPGDVCFGDADVAPASTWVTNSTGIRVTRKADLTNKIKLMDSAAAAADNGLSFSYAIDSGIVSGSLRIDFKDGSTRKAKFRGIVMPGWGARDCSSCSDSKCERRPFISGACYFEDEWGYTDAQERSRAARVIRGCPFSVGVQPGL